MKRDRWYRCPLLGTLCVCLLTGSMPLAAQPPNGDDDRGARPDFSSILSEDECAAAGGIWQDGRGQMMRKDGARDENGSRVRGSCAEKQCDEITDFGWGAAGVGGAGALLSGAGSVIPPLAPAGVLLVTIGGAGVLGASMAWFASGCHGGGDRRDY